MVEQDNQASSNQGNAQQNNPPQQSGQSQPTNSQPQQAGNPQQGNVVRPQQQATQNNSRAPQQAPPQNVQKQKSPPANKKQSAPEKKDAKDMSSYERRFRDFVKRRFGGLIGDMLLENELKELNVNDLSLLDETKQLEIMNNVLEDVFKKHHMDKAKNETRIDMYIQLCLDKAANMMKQELNDEVHIGFIEITHHDENGIEKFVSEDVEDTFWCIPGVSSGDLDSWLNIIVPERESMMLMTEYSKSKNIAFNPMDEKQKRDIMFRILRLIFDSINSIAAEIMKTNITYSLDDIKVLDIDLSDEIKKSIGSREKEKGSRPDMISARFEVKVGNLPFNVYALVNH